ncbi:MAG: ChuX/HutX family heme-like substrate-binding protein [Thiotrichales bacterium]
MTYPIPRSMIQPPSLAARWQALRVDFPNMRIRDAAGQLGVSEAELLATGCGRNVVRLLPEFATLLAELQALGPLLGITRNDSVVLEHEGSYENLRVRGPLGVFLPPGIDVRLFLHRWRHAYAVDENRRLSLQFFDAHGVAAHKVYALESIERLPWQHLIERYRHPDQSDDEAVLPLNPTRTGEPVGKLYHDGLRAHWRALRDPNEGQALILAHGGDARRVYAALGTEFARPVTAEVVEHLLERLSAEPIASTIRVTNSGAIQRYAGPIRKLLRTGPWFNVLDPGFNLHLRTRAIATAWWVRLPTANGWVTHLEVFDHDGHEILRIADHREPDQAESPRWTELLSVAANKHALAIPNE